MIICPSEIDTLIDLVKLIWYKAAVDGYTKCKSKDRD